MISINILSQSLRKDLYLEIAEIRHKCFHLLCAVWLVNLLEQLMPMGFSSAHRGSTDGSLRLNLTLQTMENSRK